LLLVCQQRGSAIGHDFAHRHVHGVVLRRIEAEKVVMMVVRQLLVAARVAACFMVRRVQQLSRTRLTVACVVGLALYAATQQRLAWKLSHELLKKKPVN
jgi:hypothetical protein